jgi:hypothetical protein
MNASVPFFIVQERRSGGKWQDDPDQPDVHTHGFEQAKQWMEDDNKWFCGHALDYEHRIIERVETQVYPAKPCAGKDARR